MLLASIGDESPMCLPCVETRVPERRVLVIEGSQHIALASASGKREKGLSATVGSVKAVSKMRSGDLLVEISTTKQAEQLLALQMLANIPITVLPHANLNSSRGVISESDLYNVPEQEILEGLQDQKSYLRCSVRPYIPNPLRCFQCQRFGHSKPTCRGKPTCARCGAVGHDSGELKIKNRLTYPEARLAVTNRTPIQGLSYAAVAKKVTTSSALQETFLKSCHTAKIRRYGCFRKDTEGSSVSGGVCIFTSLDIPSSALSLHTSLQAVAVRIHSTSLFTVCCLYLPPNVVIRQQDLNDLVDQLPAPFVILGDFNGHSTLWGSVKTNHRGRQIEQLAVISDAMVKTESVDTAVQDVTNVLIDAADLSIPKSSSHSFQRYKPWWNADCQTAYKNQRKLWGTFRRYPTTENLIAFKRAKALARRIRRQCQRESWIKYVSSITSSTTSQQLWRKVKAANGLYRDFSIPILETSTALYSSPLDVANLIGKTFASVSSSDSYSPAFQATKNRLERTPINFRCRQPLPYNCDFDMFELKRALSSAHNTSPGPDGISYVLLSPFERGFTSKSPLPIQPNMEGAGVSYSMARSHSDPHFKT
ncbi:RNA-directed DNA polymerase from mobile element jockey [Trichonephila clavipes]|nr:RNA-directed DNA polymerase from mobile element jockey [Trichonephila clavipes]